MSDAITDAVVRAMRGMEGYEPAPLLDDVLHHLRRTGEALTESELVEIVTASNPNDKARLAFHTQLIRWDAADGEGWTENTEPSTAARRDVIGRRLALGNDARSAVDDAYPLDAGAVIISNTPADWDPWYTDELAADSGFYWNGYRRVLEKKMSGEAVHELDRVTREVVRRLADPTRKQPYQAKGLVVGHVQSGKTANFTGVLAKAADAGYRLVIVLTGTIELLRGQTQRRIDMELVGEENILGGRDKHDPDQIKDIDYAGTGDLDWQDGRFLRYGKYPHDLGRPAIRRLTNAAGDYRSLKNGLGYLDFRSERLPDPAKRLYDPANLYSSDVRLAVVKKNSTVLQKLVSDLKAIRADLTEIPTLIIDDEADQATINTKDPRKDSPERRERTAINKLIAELLAELPRAQYIGYTATPFANVFVDPDDVDDVFPKDFIVSLDPPAAYMGGRQFHDLDRDIDDPVGGLAESNEAAFVRGLYADLDNDDAERREEIRNALDAYVLSGALKLFRKSEGYDGDYRHHTMLVHESVRQADHAELAATVEDVWLRAGYSSPEGGRRLWELWTGDFRAVQEARAPEAPMPPDFRTLRPFIGEATGRIRSGYRPVIVVNGAAEKDYIQNDLDFQGGDVWKILVGGAKLSRGFTVEGLTTTYYTRRTTAADTLMQMGRWFGYRFGYGDLVRLYIGRNVPGSRKDTAVDLYKAFEAIVRDEEDFREQLRQYQGIGEDGRPRVRPIDVPPLVFQSLPWLSPTGRNKMFNARLTTKGEGGKVRDFFQQPDRDPAINGLHFAAVEPLLDAALATGSRGTFFHIPDTPADASPAPYSARYAVVDAQTVLDVIRKFRWNKNFSIAPTVDFIEQAMAEGNLTDWAVIVPDLARTSARVATHSVDGYSLDILTRTRRSERSGMFSGSSPRQRLALETVSGGALAPGHRHRDRVTQLLGEPEYRHISEKLVSPSGTRGAVLLTFAADKDDVTPPSKLEDPTPAGHIATLFSLVLPYRSAPSGRVAFTVKYKDGRVTYRIKPGSDD
ncbi:Z1 domain-containing protein [Promicromonospora sp. NFX87]|uniref:Z1 domain-containing protein n=1 Tax=Promicromonospora sp. NFX87 TaxID=3402691 RepID=UPI003AFA36C4